MVRRSAPPLSRERGLTLLELITVLAIIAVLLSAGVGIYRKVSATHVLPAAVSQVSTVIRSARNFSVSAGLPSRVYVHFVSGFDIRRGLHDSAPFFVFWPQPSMLPGLWVGP